MAGHIRGADDAVRAHEDVVPDLQRVVHVQAAGDAARGFDDGARGDDGAAADGDGRGGGLGGVFGAVFAVGGGLEAGEVATEDHVCLDYGAAAQRDVGGAGDVGAARDFVAGVLGEVLGRVVGGDGWDGWVFWYLPMIWKVEEIIIKDFNTSWEMRLGLREKG